MSTTYQLAPAPPLVASVNPFQAQVLQWKAATLAGAVSAPPPATDKPPVNTRPLVLTSTQQFNYPGPGLPAITIFSYQVPPGQLARIFRHALVHIGGNPPDMIGNVTWRFLVNGAPVKGLGAQIAQIGNFQTPDEVVLWLTENDLFTVTVEVAGLAPAQAGVTAYRINGWTQPLLKGGTN
jgi:hypothetical protein